MHLEYPHKELIGKIEPRMQAHSYQRTREMTLSDLLLENRILFMVGEINYGMSMEVIMKLLHLDNSKPGADISMYINSPGGSVDDTMAIYDTMRFIGSPISTFCIGRRKSGVDHCDVLGCRLMAVGCSMSPIIQGQP